MVNIHKYIEALLHPAGGHQGSHKAYQAGNQWAREEALEQATARESTLEQVCH